MEDASAIAKYGPESLREIEGLRAQLVAQISHPGFDHQGVGADKIYRRLAELQSSIEAMREVIEEAKKASR